jgi:hypothetical protein
MVVTILALMTNQHIVSPPLPSMDDELFGASVWGPSTNSTASDTFDQRHTSGEDHAADDFDDFGSAADNTASMADDDFGDFGDFGDSQDVPGSAGFDDDSFEQPSFTPIAGPSGSRNITALRLDPFPSSDDLVAQLGALLGPIYDQQIGSTAELSNEPIRDVEGISQILAVRESRDLYNLIAQPPPSTKPPNWVRSRIRRQHLITLGIPVNLDEVLEPHMNGKSPLPPLNITTSTRPMSAPPGPRKTPHSNGGVASSAANSRAGSRSGTPHPDVKRATPNLGPKPVIDEAAITRLVETDPGEFNRRKAESMSCTHDLYSSINTVTCIVT